jgi:hypothetical protein
MDPTKVLLCLFFFSDKREFEWDEPRFEATLRKLTRKEPDLAPVRNLLLSRRSKAGKQNWERALGDLLTVHATYAGDSRIPALVRLRGHVHTHVLDEVAPLLPPDLLAAIKKSAPEFGSALRS